MIERLRRTQDADCILGTLAINLEPVGLACLFEKPGGVLPLVQSDVPREYPIQMAAPAGRDDNGRKRHA